MAGSHTVGNGLHTQPIGIRLGLTGLVLVLLGGLAASASHLVNHYANRDERPEFTLDDIKGAYHGINTPSLLNSALERGHPAELPAAEKQILLDWLAGTRIVEDYDSLDLEIPPAEIIASRCLDCHTRQTGAETGTPLPPLEYFDDIKSIAFSREIRATPDTVLTMSTHAHALSMSIQGIVVVALALLTRWPVRTISLLVAVMGLGLLGDIGGWWLARFSPSWALCIVISGVGYSIGQAILLALVLADLWWPSRAESKPNSKGQSNKEDR